MTNDKHTNFTVRFMHIGNPKENSKIRVKGNETKLISVASAIFYDGMYVG